MQALWMVLGALIFATMGVCVKFASAWFTSAELVLYRGLIGIVFLWLLARSRGVALATQYPGMHAWRSLVGVVSLGAWFYAIAHMPLATAMTLNYMSSVWIAAFLVGGALLAWIRSRARRQRAAPAAAGPAGPHRARGLRRRRPDAAAHHRAEPGVRRPGGPAVGPHRRLCLHAGDGAGRLGEPEARTVFYFAVGSAVAGGSACCW